LYAYLLKSEELLQKLLVDGEINKASKTEGAPARENAPNTRAHRERERERETDKEKEHLNLRVEQVKGVRERERERESSVKTFFFSRNESARKRCVSKFSSESQSVWQKKR